MNGITGFKFLVCPRCKNKNNFLAGLLWWQHCRMWSLATTVPNPTPLDTFLRGFLLKSAYSNNSKTSSTLNMTLKKMLSALTKNPLKTYEKQNNTLWKRLKFSFKMIGNILSVGCNHICLSHYFYSWKNKNKISDPRYCFSFTGKPCRFLYRKVDFF